MNGLKKNITYSSGSALDFVLPLEEIQKNNKQKELRVYNKYLVKILNKELPKKCLKMSHDEIVANIDLRVRKLIDKARSSNSRKRRKQS